METIEVRYKPILVIPGDPLAPRVIYHKYIVYTNSNGERYAARGGPTTYPGAPDSTANSPFGPIDTKYGPYEPRDPVTGREGFPDYAPEGTHPSEPIATGDDLSSDWEKIKEAMDDIKNEQHPYEPAARNSNTTVDESLRRAGLPEPQLDDFGENWSPASGRDISAASDDLPPWGGDFFGPTEDELDIPPAVADAWNSLQRFAPRRDPLTFDLDGDGLETVGIDPNNPTLFDHDADGIKTATGWVSPDDAFLVLDRNGNGTIDNGTELFGDSTPIADTEGNTRNAVDGFDALAAGDINADGWVDSQDTNFNNLRLWQDLNQDGISQAGELFTLTQKGIAAIHVSKTENSTLLPNGNVIADLGHYTKTDGSEGTLGTTGQLGDVDLREETFYSQFTDSIPLTPDAQLLPSIHGSGQVRDLQEAASLSPDLTALLQQYAAASTRAEQISLLDGVIRAWSDTSTMKTTATGAYDGHPLRVVFETIDEGSIEHQAMLDKLTVLERFNGRTFQQVPPGTDPVTVYFFPEHAGGVGHVALLNEAYEVLRKSVYDSLFLQTRGKQYLDAIGLTVDADGNVALDFFAMQSLLDDRLRTNPVKGLGDALDLHITSGTDLGTTGWDTVAYLSRAERVLTETEAGRAILDDPGLLGPLFHGFRLGRPTDETIVGSANDDRLLGGAGDDILSGGDGHNLLWGQRGDDIVHGGAGDDFLIGGYGNDILDGGTGIDIYYYQRGDGADTVIEIRTGGDDYHTYNDRLVFGAGISSLDFTFTHVGNDLYINLGGDDSLTFQDWYLETENRIDYFQFADGTVLPYLDFLNLRGTDQFGTNADDNLRGREEIDRIYGGAGNDTLDGLGGNDSLWGETGDDVLHGSDGDDSLDGGEGLDRLYGENGDDMLEGDEDNDTLDGGGDQDVLDGGTGDDILRGGDGNDHLTGGLGDDVLEGGRGLDTYYYSRGDGADTVIEIRTGGDDYLTYNDRLIFGPGIGPLDFAFTHVGNDLHVDMGDGDHLIFKDWYLETENRVDYFELADGAVLPYLDFLNLKGTDQFGTDGDDVLTGREENDRIWGGAGNDILNGLGGNDVLWGEAGNDTLYGGDGDDRLNGAEGTDRLYGEGGDDILDGGESDNYLDGGFGSDILNAGSGNDIMRGGSGSDMLAGDLGDDELWGEAGNDTLFGGDGNDLLDSGFGNDTLYGGAGDDTLQDANGNDAFFGGLGNDLLKGHDGSDTYHFSRGDGHDTIIDFGPERNDRFVFGPGTGLTDLHLVREAYDLTLDLGAGDRITVRDWFQTDGGNCEIEYFQFAEGLYSASQVLSTVPMVALPTENDDVFNTGSGADEIRTLGGNDMITDKGGNNTIYAGTGNDWIWVEGNGTNFIYGGDGNDTVQASFDANNTIDGGEGDDYLLVHRTGGSPLTHNTFIGGLGNDQLFGSASTDTFLYNRGDGNDIVNDYDYGAQGATDTIQFGTGISSNDVTVSRAGDHLLLSILDSATSLAAGQITVQRWFADPVHHRVESFTFVDGMTLTNDQMQGRAGHSRPVLAVPLPDVEVGDNAAFAVGIPAGSFTDPDSGEVLTYRATLGDGSALPDWLAFDSQTGTLSGRPYDQHIGSYDITVTAIDPTGYFAADGFTLTVINANDPPQIAAPIPDLSTDEDTVLSIPLPAGTFVDPNAGDVLTYNAVLEGGTDLPGWLAFDPATQTFTGTPTNDDVGSLNLTVTATDSEGLSVSDTFTLTVNNVNDVPVAIGAIPDQSTDEDVPVSLTLDPAAFADNDLIHGDRLTLSAALADGTELPVWLSFDANTSTFSGTPDNWDVGTYDIRVTATDTAGTSASDTFTLTVHNVNDNSVLANALNDIATDEDTPFGFTVPTDTFDDDDFIHGDSLTLSAALADGSVLPDWLVFDVTTGTFTGTPDNWDVGSYEVRVTANDTASTSVSDVFTLTVNNVNDAPVLANAIPDQATTEGIAFNYVLVGNTFHDDDAIHGDSLTYTAALTDGRALPNWLSCDTSTQTFTGTAPVDSLLTGTDGDDMLVDSDTGISGTWDIRVTATDTSGVNTQDTFTLTLQGVAGNDTLVGGKGNDVLSGGGGDDTYIYNLSDGLDRITDYAGNDAVQFGADFSFDNTVIRTEGGVAHLRFLDDDGNEGEEGMDIALNPDGSSPIETFAFADGNTYTLNDLSIRPLTTVTGNGGDTVATGRHDDTVYVGNGNDSIRSGSGHDTLYGENGNDALYGEGGNDTLYGANGDDRLEGGCGDDALYDGNGNDTLIGGRGNDTLYLGRGDNVINFNASDGQDTLTADPTATAIGNNRLELGAGLTPDKLWFERAVNDLRISVLGTNDGLTLKDWYNGSHAVRELHTSEGDVLLDTQVERLVQAMAAFAPQGSSDLTLTPETQEQLQPVLAAGWMPAT